MKGIVSRRSSKYHRWNMLQSHQVGVVRRGLGKHMSDELGGL